MGRGLPLGARVVIGGSMRFGKLLQGRVWGMIALALLLGTNAFAQTPAPNDYSDPK